MPSQTPSKVPEHWESKSRTAIKNEELINIQIRKDQFQKTGQQAIKVILRSWNLIQDVIDNLPPGIRFHVKYPINDDEVKALLQWVSDIKYPSKLAAETKRKKRETTKKNKNKNKNKKSKNKSKSNRKSKSKSRTIDNNNSESGHEIEEESDSDSEDNSNNNNDNDENNTKKSKPKRKSTKKKSDDPFTEYKKTLKQRVNYVKPEKFGDELFPKWMDELFKYFETNIFQKFIIEKLKIEMDHERKYFFMSIVKKQIWVELLKANVDEFKQKRATPLFCARSFTHYNRELNKMLKKLVGEEAMNRVLTTLGYKSEPLNYKKSRAKNAPKYIPKYCKFPSSSDMAVTVLNFMINEEKTKYEEKYGTLGKTIEFSDEDYSTLNHKQYVPRKPFFINPHFNNTNNNNNRRGNNTNDNKNIKPELRSSFNKNNGNNSDNNNDNHSTSDSSSEGGNSTQSSSHYSTPSANHYGLNVKHEPNIIANTNFRYLVDQMSYDMSGIPPRIPQNQHQSYTQLQSQSLSANNSRPSSASHSRASTPPDNRHINGNTHYNNTYQQRNQQPHAPFTYANIGNDGINMFNQYQNSNVNVHSFSQFNSDNGVFPQTQTQIQTQTHPSHGFTSQMQIMTQKQQFQQIEQQFQTQPLQSINPLTISNAIRLPTQQHQQPPQAQSQSQIQPRIPPRIQTQPQTQSSTYTMIRPIQIKTTNKIPNFGQVIGGYGPTRGGEYQDTMVRSRNSPYGGSIISGNDNLLFSKKINNNKNDIFYCRRDCNDSNILTPPEQPLTTASDSIQSDISGSSHSHTTINSVMTDDLVSNSQQFLSLSGSQHCPLPPPPLFNIGINHMPQLSPETIELRSVNNGIITNSSGRQPQSPLSILSTPSNNSTESHHSNNIIPTISTDLNMNCDDNIIYNEDNNNNNNNYDIFNGSVIGSNSVIGNMIFNTNVFDTSFTPQTSPFPPNDDCSMS